MRLLLVAGTTRTAEIPGLSAAGASPEATAATPSADAEIVEYGDLVRGEMVPVSPAGCPTPAVMTRAVRELLGFELTVLDAGLAEPTGAPTVSLPVEPGADIREPDPVPNAEDAFAAGREFAHDLPDEELLVGETIPGGTTTALGVLTALGETEAVSSSLPENPLAHKREVVAEGLAASDLEPGGAVGDPLLAVRSVGDPVLAGVAGVATGAIETGVDLTLAGGTQMLAAAALVRHAGIEAPFRVATTSFVAADETAAVRETATSLDVNLAVTDPGFEHGDHVAFERYLAGVAKEGVGMGGALWLAERKGIDMSQVRDRIVSVYDRVVGDGP